MSKLHQTCRTDLDPTFWEFVQFVIHHPESDRHWAPASTICSPCIFNFTFIIKFEELAEEEPVMIKYLGLAKRFPPIWKNRQEGLPTSKYLDTYFNMLEEDDWRKIMRVYAQDIDLFM